MSLQCRFWKAGLSAQARRCGIRETPLTLVERFAALHAPQNGLHISFRHFKLDRREDRTIERLLGSEGDDRL